MINDNFKNEHERPLNWSLIFYILAYPEYPIFYQRSFAVANIASQNIS